MFCSVRKIPFGNRHQLPFRLPASAAAEVRALQPRPLLGAGFCGRVQAGRCVPLRSWLSLRKDTFFSNCCSRKHNCQSSVKSLKAALNIALLILVASCLKGACNSSAVPAWALSVTRSAGLGLLWQRGVEFAPLSCTSLFIQCTSLFPCGEANSRQNFIWSRAAVCVHTH